MTPVAGIVNTRTPCKKLFRIFYYFFDNSNTKFCIQNSAFDILYDLVAIFKTLTIQVKKNYGGGVNMAIKALPTIALAMGDPAGVSPELMVIAVGSGSVIFSHVNDPGFWLFKEYFNLTIGETIKSWSVLETIISVCGLVGCLLLGMVV